MLEALIGGGFILAGVWLGWYLGSKSAATAAAAERKWQEEQTVRERQERAAEELHRKLLDIMHRGPTLGSISASEGKTVLPEFHRDLIRAYSGSLAQVEPGIWERVRRLDMLVFMAVGEAQGAPTVSRVEGTSNVFVPSEETTINLWVIGEAARDLIEALVRVQLREPLGEPLLPDTSKIIELVHPGGRNESIANVGRWLRERG